MGWSVFTLCKEIGPIQPSLLSLCNVSALSNFFIRMINIQKKNKLQLIYFELSYAINVESSRNIDFCHLQNSKLRTCTNMKINLIN